MKTFNASIKMYYLGKYITGRSVYECRSKKELSSKVANEINIHKSHKQSRFNKVLAKDVYFYLVNKGTFEHFEQDTNYTYKVVYSYD